MRTALIASLAAALAFAGCRGGDSEDDVIGNTPSGDSLKINPASVSIARGNARQFNATSGNSVVNWDIEGKHSDGTIIYPNGNLKIA
ncbi:MAG: hypothetical protein LBJ86_06650, partial [Spirochaetaceae bacterium]|nr:hypothetical protein [Spirochaetaceae bacterium]